MADQRLELTWIGKGEKISPEPRILLEQAEHSNTANAPDTQNMLIYGDNLLALKSLEQKYAGKIKCVYIDPPYNTGSAFEHYDDNLEHSKWLSLMKPRLELLRNLLSNDGSIWISIDDDEGHYLKVLCDEVFGRSNFINMVVWQKKYAPQNDAKWLSDNHDMILVYAKNKQVWRPNLLPRTKEMNARYKNPDNDPRGVWKSSDLSVKTYSASCDYPITTPTGRIVNPPPGRCWRTSKEKFAELVADNRVWFGADGNNVPSIKRFLTEVKDGTTSMTVWLYEEVGHNQDARKEVVEFNRDNVFATPKPEKLLQKILTLATKEGDLVLDSFLGSGTTAAVAHKMNRRYIGVELGDHAYTHCKVRLDKVIEGEQGGISKAVNWQGGGGYKFYTLAPSMVRINAFGIEVINTKEYNAEMLAAAMCLHKGYEYAPDKDIFFKQGKRGTQNFIYTTTNHLTVEELDYIHDSLAADEHLLITATGYTAGLERRHKNIMVQKIPQAILGKCEFARDNYNLNIIEREDFEEVEDDV